MSTRFSQNRICRLLLPSLCVLMLLLGWSVTAGADPLRRLDQIKAAMAAPKAPDMGAFAGQAPARSGLRHRRPSGAFPPGLPLAMPSFSTVYMRDGVSFPLTVVGTDPALGQTTTIPTVIFAYRLQLADGTVFDASSDVIDGVTPVQGVLASPIFTPAPWDRRRLGITQWSDAVMRANFAERMADGYHVLLGRPTVIPVTVDVPAAFGFSFTDPKSGVLEGAVDGDWLNDQLVKVMQSYGIPPTTLPIHLFSQVISAAYGFEIFAGYHFFYPFTTSPGATVAAPFIETAYFSKALKIPNDNPQGVNTAALAHEIAEWLMDPTTSNVTMPWQDPAEPDVCDNPLIEVGDPLEYIAPGVDVGGYRFPDVALLPWFTGSQVSRSVNHQFSLFGTLTRRSSVCPNYANFGQAAIAFTGADGTLFPTVFTGINNQHQVVGHFTVGNVLISFIISNIDPIAGNPGTVDQVNFPGSLLTVATGVNDAGNVVGFYVDGQGQEHGFLLQGGAYTSIDFPGAIATEANGTNKHGDVVGDYTDSAGLVHGFTLMNGRFQDVDAPFASGGLSVRGINDSRIVVGMYTVPGTAGFASFSGPPGNLQAFNFPQVSPLDVSEFPVPFHSSAHGLNNSREIVGDVNLRGTYVAKAGLFEKVAPGFAVFDGAQSAQLNGVNDAGVVAGAFTDRTGTFAILLVPGSALGLPFARMTIAAP
jgi:probable HAF family extracellular repeat protein